MEKRCNINKKYLIATWSNYKNIIKQAIASRYFRNNVFKKVLKISLTSEDTNGITISNKYEKSSYNHIKISRQVVLDIEKLKSD